MIGECTIIGAGVKIIGDSRGPVRIGNDVQILSNAVLDLLALLTTSFVASAVLIGVGGRRVSTPPAVAMGAPGT